MSLRRKLTLGGAALSLLPLALAQQPASAATAGDIEVTITVKSISFPELNDCKFIKMKSCSTAELLFKSYMTFCANHPEEYGYEWCLKDLDDMDRSYTAVPTGLPHIVNEGDSFTGSKLGMAENDYTFGEIPRASGVIYMKPGEKLRLAPTFEDYDSGPWFGLHDEISVGDQVIDLPANDTVGHYTYLSAPDGDGRTRIEYEVKAHKVRKMPRPS